MNRWLLTLVFLTGCRVGPDYVPPESCVSDQWATQGGTIEAPPMDYWWESFEDPLLNCLEEEAATYNYDLAAAESRILRARALVEVAAANYYPQVFFDANATKTYFSKNGPVFAIQGPGSNQTTGLNTQNQLPQIPQKQNLFNTAFDATWEIDFFGLTARMVEAQVAAYQTIIEERNGLLLTLFAEVARNYMELRGAQAHIQLTQTQLNLLQQEVDFVSRRLQGGLGNQLDLRRSEAELRTLAAHIPSYHAQMYQNIYALSVLTGREPEALLNTLQIIDNLPTPIATVPMGLRSDLLRRRPDIREAEWNLAQANALVGVAIASFYPTITLSGLAGTQSLQLKDLFKSSSVTYSYGVDFNIPIYTGGYLEANLSANRAAFEVAYATYQQTVLNAVQEAESDLATWSQDSETVTFLQQAVDSHQQVVHLSEERFKQGLTSLKDHLDTQREMILNEQNLLTAQIQQLLDQISLFKALGGCI